MNGCIIPGIIWCIKHKATKGDYINRYIVPKNVWCIKPRPKGQRMLYDTQNYMAYQTDKENKSIAIEIDIKIKNNG